MSRMNKIFVQAMKNHEESGMKLRIISHYIVVGSISFAMWVQTEMRPYFYGVMDHLTDFQYARGSDSVLMVSKEDYKTCNVNNPMASWTEGPHEFHLQGHSIVYFISGELGHCQAGQKVAIETFNI